MVRKLFLLPSPFSELPFLTPATALLEDECRTMHSPLSGINGYDPCILFYALLLLVTFYVSTDISGNTFPLLLPADRFGSGLDFPDASDLFVQPLRSHTQSE